MLIFILWPVYFPEITKPRIHTIFHHKKYCEIIFTLGRNKPYRKGYLFFVLYDVKYVGASENEITIGGHRTKFHRKWQNQNRTFNRHFQLTKDSKINDILLGWLALGEEQISTFFVFCWLIVPQNRNPGGHFLHGAIYS